MAAWRSIGPDLRVRSLGDPPALPPDLSRQVDGIWDQALRQSDGILYDGRIFSVERWGDGVLEGRFTPYRRFVAQRREPDLANLLNLRPLAVSGLITVDGNLVLGQRSAVVGSDRGLWELVPSGSVERGCLQADGGVDYVGQLLLEVEEELNVPRDRVVDPMPFGLWTNGQTRVTEVAIAAHFTCPEAELRACFNRRANREYDDLVVIAPGDIALFVRRNAGRVDLASLALLAGRGFLAAGEAGDRPATALAGGAP